MRSIANDTWLTKRFMLNALSMFIAIFEEMGETFHSIAIQNRAAEVAPPCVEKQETANVSIARRERLSVVEFGQMPDGSPSVQTHCKLVLTQSCSDCHLLTGLFACRGALADVAERHLRTGSQQQRLSSPKTG